MKQRELEKIEAARQKIEQQEESEFGEYFECIRCDQWTIHVDRQDVCENINCPTNAGKRFHLKESNKPLQIQDLKGKDEFELKMQIVTMEKKYTKQLKERDEALSKIKKELTTQIYENEELKDKIAKMEKLISRLRNNEPSQSSDSEDFDNECTICTEILDEDLYDKNESNVKLQCIHTQFHHTCLMKWLAKNPKCPLCNALA